MTSSAAQHVAMGSSFAAGPGLTPRAAGSPRAAGRSSINFAHLFAAKRSLQLLDVSYSGATTADLLHAKGERPAQLDAVTSATRLVTMIIGGNDIGYIGGLTMSSVPAILPGLLRARGTLAGWMDESTLDSRFDALHESLVAIVRSAHERSPLATVALIDYLTLLPQNPAQRAGRLTPSVAGWGREVAARMSATFRDVASTEGAIFVPAGEKSRAHHAWAADPWTRHFHLSLRGGAPFHPNAAGMMALAQLLDETLPPL